MGVVLDFSGILVAEVLEHDTWTVSFLLCAGVRQQRQGLFVALAELVERPPLEGCILADAHLSGVALASQVDLFRVDLVRNLDKKHLKIVITNLIRLEHNLHLICGMRCNSSHRRNQSKGQLLALILNPADQILQREADGEGRNVFYGEGLLRDFAEEDVTEV